LLAMESALNGSFDVVIPRTELIETFAWQLNLIEILG
jgi:hypothetical protein